MGELSKIVSINNLSEINLIKDSSIGGKILAGLCLAGGIITIIYQRKKKELLKNLDDYSYRDLFHFFINPEFHWDKIHLAKGFFY